MTQHSKSITPLPRGKLLSSAEAPLSATEGTLFTTTSTGQGICARLYGSSDDSDRHEQPNLDTAPHEAETLLRADSNFEKAQFAALCNFEK
jgi:hypothetical protein